MQRIMGELVELEGFLTPLPLLKGSTWEAALVEICEARDEKYQGEPQEPLTDSAPLLKYWSDL